DGIRDRNVTGVQTCALPIWFLRSINSPESTSGAVGHGAGRSLSVNVSYDELAATREPAEDWLTYSGSYWSSRHSALRQIDRENRSEERRVGKRSRSWRWWAE